MLSQGAKTNKGVKRKQSVSPEEKSIIRCVGSQRRSRLTEIKYKMSSSEALFTRHMHESNEIG